MIQEFKQIWKPYVIGMIWLFGLLWPLLGIHPDGSVTFSEVLKIWSIVFAGSLFFMFLYVLKKSGGLEPITAPLANLKAKNKEFTDTVPKWVWFGLLMAAAMVYPLFTNRYAQDVAIMVLIYICLGLGLNLVVGLTGLLDLGYIAFYGVGAYAYALLNVHFGFGFWQSLPLAAAFACISGAIIGYPTLRMRGDYLAIVTLGFGEIVRLILNNWMGLTNGPNGILGIKPPGIYIPTFDGSLGFMYFYLKKLHFLYYVALVLAVFTIIMVYRLNYSRIGRAWESIREDETAAELMGVNTFRLKLLAYVMGAFFAGIAGAFFAARMKFVSPESFGFLESAMVLSMVVLGGMGSIPGIVLGVAALIVLPEVFREIELYRMFAFGAAMVLMMLFRPKGIIPAKRVGTRSEEKEG